MRLRTWRRTLLSTRWIKPLQRRKAGKWTVHLIVCLKTMGATNHMITDGLVITGKSTWPRRMRKEQRRCLNCQSLTTKHLAAKCNQHTTCNTCIKDHHTAHCMETDRDRFRFMNCNLLGHASYKFFPSHNTWTWEQEPNYVDASPTDNQGPPNLHPNGENMHAKEHLHP